MTEPTQAQRLEEKRRRVRALLARQAEQARKAATARMGFDAEALPEYARLTYDMAMTSSSQAHAESQRFSQWVDDISKDNAYSFEVPRMEAQRAMVEVQRHDGQRLKLLNFGSYNYLGLSNHPEVIDAAKAALDQYGLGAASSPILSGTLGLHRELEQALLDFYGLPDRGVSLFSSGYGVNLGAIQAFVKQGHYVIVDRSVHVSILEGAQLSKANILYFRHNDAENLDGVLRRIAGEGRRMLVCTEGVFSADGDYGALAEISEVCRHHGAALLVDEAHSILVAGENGRGAAEAAGILEHADLIVLTFSKSFGGVGGALIASQQMSRYVNWYAR
ncbi:MAG: aminotransferase class I/II-fold pyridoxal phosphate-dependent enzyme, partial [Myxococcota bacterium]